MTQDRNEVLGTLKEHLIHAHNRMIQQADMHRRKVEYKVRDMVNLKTQRYSPRYYGPHEIIERVGEVAY